MRSAIFLVLALCVAAMGASRPVATSAPVKPGSSAKAVIAAGLGGSKTYSRNVQDWARRFHKLLTATCGLDESNVALLTEQANTDPKSGPVSEKSTRDNVMAAVKRLGAKTGPDEQFIVVLIGHGQVQEPTGKLCLPGKDIGSDELGKALDELASSKIVLINCASGGEEFIKDIALGGRVVISAGGASIDGSQTYFAEFFLQGYELNANDLDKDKNVSLLEAYVYAARETANFYHRQYRVAQGDRKPQDPVKWFVQGRRTRKTWRKLYADSDNILSPRPANQTGPVVSGDPDNEPDTEPKFGKFDENWHFRRLLTEHARIDDEDSRKGFYLWQPYEFQQLPPDEPGQVGHLARRTALGSSAPIAVKKAAE